jgi:hypothetical protein
MGGSFRTAKLFLDSLRARQKEMEWVSSLDPTPLLRQKTESRRKLLEKLEEMHRKFGELMKMTDAKLQAGNSNERSSPLLGDRELVAKIAERKMDEKEYTELVEGPTLNVKNISSIRQARDSCLL